MSFQNMKIKIRYRSNEDDFPRDFYMPILHHTEVYKRSVGYFSTTALVDITTGLFDLASRGGKVYLICSPKLDKEDIEAIDFGYKTREEVIINALNVSLTAPLNHFEEERLNLVASMIASGMLEIKVAFMKTQSKIKTYHEKIAVFKDKAGNSISFTGSMNETDNGFDGNFESIYTFCSWKEGAEQREAAEIAESDFDAMWSNNTKGLAVEAFPSIVLEKLMTYKKDSIDYETDKKEYNYREYINRNSAFHRPEWVQMRPYQEDARKNWFRQGCRGIFSMCTGAGKTFTALDCTVALGDQKNDHLAVFVVCPYIHLVSQWEEDAIEWGPTPIVAHSKSPQKDWQMRLQKAYRRFKRDGTPFVCITTNDTFLGDKVQPIIDAFSEEDDVLLIIDEAHNFGAETRSIKLPINVKYRIALSATIKRYMDKTGTEQLFSYFGAECIVYGLEEAIRDNALVHYEYHPVTVYLEEDELRQYLKITKQLRNYLINENGIMRISEAGKPLVYKRTRLLAGARGKIDLLMEMLEPYRNDKNILVYCGAADVNDEFDQDSVRQIDLVTKKMRTELGMGVHRFTADEGLKERQDIKHFFQAGIYQAITAIKCLDEGVNIPGIHLAFIMSSSRNPKEFIQRRGRLLRKSEGKAKAVIYDFITLPRDLDNVLAGDEETDWNSVFGEIARMHEFGKLADNPGEAIALINKIMSSYNQFVDIEEELKWREDYYGE